MTLNQAKETSQNTGTLKLAAAGRSHVGCKRKENQDDYLIDEASGLFIVADGMGGHENGRIASMEAVKSFSRSMRNSENSCAHMADAVQVANTHILSLNQVTGPTLQKMGTTIVALAVDAQDASHATLVHVGDSRLYLYREGNAMQITRDHSAREDWIDRGRQGPEPTSNVISRAVGIFPELESCTCEMSFKSGDIALLCTDGLSDYLSPEDITEILSGIDEAGSQRTCDALIELGLERESRDNLTALIVHFS